MKYTVQVVAEERTVCIKKLDCKSFLTYLACLEEQGRLDSFKSVSEDNSVFAVQA